MSIIIFSSWRHILSPLQLSSSSWLPWSTLKPQVLIKTWPSHDHHLIIIWSSHDHHMTSMMINNRYLRYSEWIHMPSCIRDVSAIKLKIYFIPQWSIWFDDESDEDDKIWLWIWSQAVSAIRLNHTVVQWFKGLCLYIIMMTMTRNADDYDDGVDLMMMMKKYDDDLNIDEKATW